MNVLSVFDGMSCGQIALNRAGVNYDKYYASEVDKYVIKVAQANYPKTIQVGDVTKIKAIDLPKIDLLIGGSPCQGFSFAGKQLNFNDPRSALFFEYMRLLKELRPRCFLLENVKMKKEYQGIISEHLGVEPVLINSALVSAQNRERLYWSNVNFGGAPKDKEIFWCDVKEPSPEKHIARVVGRYLVNGKRQDGKQKTAGLTTQYIEFRNDNKTNALTTVLKDNVAVSQAKPHRVVAKKCSYRHLTPIEYERLQTVPDNYTNHVSNTQRYKMLGNGWTVDVIAHIFQGLKRTYGGE